MAARLLSLLGIACFAAPFVTTQLPLPAPLFWVVGMALMLTGTASLALNFYRKTAPGEAYVRTGAGGPLVVRDGGGFVVPMLHEVVPVTLETIRLEIGCAGPASLASADGAAVEARVTLHARVGATGEEVLQAARSWGQRAADPTALAAAMRDRVVAALRQAALDHSAEDLLAHPAGFTATLHRKMEATLGQSGVVPETLVVESLTLAAPGPQPLAPPVGAIATRHPASTRGVGVQVTREPSAVDLPLPAYATAGAVGLDLHAAVDAPVTLAPGERAAIPTGLRLAVPEGFEAQIRPRSGLARDHGISMANAVGTLDPDFRGVVQVLLINHGSEPFTVQRGDRIAQIVLARVERVIWREVAELPPSSRGDGGFGHTGVAPRAASS
jgi:dUTP pyrophosphatase